MTEIRLRPDANLENLAKTLAQQENEPNNVWGQCQGIRPHEAIGNYLRWVEAVTGQLGNHLVPSQVEAIIRTRHYWALRQMDGSEAGAIAQVGNELTARGAALKALRLEAVALFHRWNVEGVFVVPDTNMLVQTNTFFDAIDWPTALAIDADVHLVIPIAVIDELDQLKRSNKNSVRSKARQTVKKLEALVTKPGERATLPTTGQSSKTTTVEVLVDPISHERLSDSDSEIVDRARYLSELVRSTPGPGDVRLATWDGGMRFRALGIGLYVIALPSQYEDVSRF